MVIINDINFEIYNLDTVDSFLSRIAAYFKTLPKFLYFSEDINDFKTMNKPIQVFDLYNYIKQNSSSIGNLKNLYNELKTKLEKNNISINEFLKVFISTNSEIKSIYEAEEDVISSFISYIVMELTTFLKEFESVNSIDVTQLVKNREDVYAKQIETNILKSNIKEQGFKTFENVKGIPFDPFELQKINFEMTINMDDKFVLDIFDMIQVDEYVPFVSCNNFYKIRKDFSPNLDWINDNDYLVLKVVQKDSVVNTEFTDVIIEKDEHIKATLKYNIKNNVSKELMINRFMNTIGNFSVTNITEKEINGVFYFPNQRINRYIFSDLVMNSREFSEYIMIDEYIISHKPTVFIHFNTPETGLITAHLTEKIVDEEDSEFKNKNMVVGSHCIRVKISKARNSKSVGIFQNTLSKLFIKYNNEYEKIINFYTRFMPLEDLETKKIKVIKKKKKETSKNIRETLAPELYVSYYTSFCGQPPKIINDDEEEDYIEQGYQVIEFPKNESEGSKPRKYICDNKKFPYPGLRENTLSNSDKFPFLPCCYENDQTEKNVFRHYYYGEDLEDTSTDQHIIKTNKILNNGQVGYLPRNIELFFNNIDSNKNYQYFRQGVSDSKNSFIECVLYALKMINVDTNIESIRKSYSAGNLAATCKQEMYDYSIKDIINKINSEDYFKPELFINLLEVYYNSNIFLFKRDIKYPDGTLVIPRHIKGYFHNKNKFDKCIFIYENVGTEPDSMQYPRCELIFRWNKKGKKDDIEYVLSKDENNTIINKAIRIFNKYNDFYILNTKVVYTDFSIKHEIVSQSIDFYGKTRMINIKFNDNIITLYTSPLQPFNVVEINNASRNYLKDINSINDFIVSLNIINVKYLETYNSIEIKGKIGNVDVSFFVNTKPSTEKIKTSYLLEYNKYKKLSRYITQYFYWLYAKYKTENSLDSSINTFANKYITIDQNYEYKDVENNLSLKSSLMKDGKLVLKSQETLNRLLFLLKMELLKTPEFQTTFVNKKTIDGYYYDTTDFNQSSSYIILKGDTSFKNYVYSLEEDSIQYILNDSINKSSIKPYFFRNIFIDGNVYIAQNCLSIKQAIQIYITWMNEKYNSLFDSKDCEYNYGFNFYAYKNKNMIEKYYIKGELNTNAKIVGFIMLREDQDDEYFEERDFYTVLLPL